MLCSGVQLQCVLFSGIPFQSNCIFSDMIEKGASQGKCDLTELLSLENKIVLPTVALSEMPVQWAWCLFRAAGRTGRAHECS